MGENREFRFQGGDILLFNGNGWLSKAIRFFDGADVNHAALAIDPTTMIEAAGNGLRTRPIDDAIKTNNFTLVMRLPNDNHLQPVVAAGNAFLKKGVPYAYQEIVLLAILSATRHVDIKNRIFRRIVRTVCDHAALLINSLLERGDELMICSEFVFRCYQDGNEPRYHLTRHDDWRSAIVLAVSSETQSVAEWAKDRPEPAVPPAPAAVGGEDPDVVAAEAKAELEPLLAAYLTEQGETGDELAPAGMVPTGAVPDTTDDEIHTSAMGLRDAWLRARQSAGEVQPADFGDLWDWFIQSTEADFVTPGDLEHMTPIAGVANLP